MTRVVLLVFLAINAWGATKSKPNCRLKSTKTYQDGRREMTYRDVYTRTPSDCELLSKSETFSSHTEYNALNKNPREQNCKVWVLIEGPDGPPALTEYGIDVSSEEECRKRGVQRKVASP